MMILATKRKHLRVITLVFQTINVINLKTAMFPKKMEFLIVNIILLLLTFTLNCVQHIWDQRQPLGPKAYVFNWRCSKTINGI